MKARGERPWRKSEQRADLVLGTPDVIERPTSAIKHKWVLGPVKQAELPPNAQDAQSGMVLGPVMFEVPPCAHDAQMVFGIGAGVMCRATAMDAWGVPCQRQQVDTLMRFGGLVRGGDGNERVVVVERRLGRAGDGGGRAVVFVRASSHRRRNLRREGRCCEDEPANRVKG